MNVLKDKKNNADFKAKKIDRTIISESKKTYIVTSHFIVSTPIKENIKRLVIQEIKFEK